MIQANGPLRSSKSAKAVEPKMMQAERECAAARRVAPSKTESQPPAPTTESPSTPKAELPAAPSAKRAWTSAEYRELIEHVRLTVPQHTPHGANVAVISKGDDALLRFEHRRGWHFPRREDGVHIGHHPLNSPEAIGYLNALRRQGATHLVVPATSFWWLDHYAAWATHLSSVARSAHRDDKCIIFALAERTLHDLAAAIMPEESISAIDGTSDALRQAAALHQIRDVVRWTLPPDNTIIAVVSGGDDRFLQLGEGRIAHHVQQLTRSKGAHRHPVNGDEALAQVRSARRAGARYLIIPSIFAWWLDHYRELRAYLDDPTRARLVARQRHVCLIFELLDGAARIDSSRTRRCAGRSRRRG